MGYVITVRRFKFDLKSITVEPVMFLYMFTVFFQYLTVQSLIYDKVCNAAYNQTVCDNLNNKTYKAEEDDVQKTTSTWFLYINIAMVLPSMFSVMLFLGPLGDRVGRKMPILFPLLGSLLACVSNILNSVYMNASLNYLLIGSFLNGLMGGFIAALMAMYSYIAHVSTLKQKTVRMGILESMVFLSGTLGTALSGIILDNTSYVFVFSLLAGIMILALLYTVVWVENVKAEDDSALLSTEQESSKMCGFCQLGFNVIKDVFLCVYNNRKNKKNLLHLSLLILIVSGLMLVTVGETDIILIFTRYHPFNWSQTTLGLYKGLESFLRGLAVLTVLPLLKVKFKVRDTSIILLGLASKMMVLIVLGVGRSTAVLFIGLVTGILQGFGSAAIRSLTSNMVPTSEQAKLFSLIGLSETIATMVATTTFNTLYNATLDFYPGFCFLMAAGIMGLCICVAIYLHVTLSKTVTHNYGTLQNEPTDDVVINADDNDADVIS